ncbi:MAG: 30S ribosomal protein S6 [Candidatus Woykebacteria bacterium]
MREYELLVLGKGDLSEAEQKNLTGELEKLIHDEKGTVEKRQDWGKRNLAYEIKKQKEGNYFLIHFLAPEPLAKKLEKKLSIDENVLRYMLLREE